MFSANNPPSLPSVDSADRQPAVRHNCEHQVAQPFSMLCSCHDDPKRAKSLLRRSQHVNLLL